MKKVIFGTLVLAATMIVPMSAMARVDVHVSIPLPPSVVFSAPPAAVVIPETYVYAFPDVQEEIFFCDGWWWRHWDGRWYRSLHHNSGWAHYPHVPSFYSRVPAGWRNDYREHRWKGHPWNHQRVSHDQLQNNWKRWESDRHWERRQNWGVKTTPAVMQPLHSREVSRQPFSQPPQVQPAGGWRAHSQPQHSQNDRPQGSRERGGYERSDRR